MSMINKPPQILLVEDDNITGFITQKLLEKNGRFQDIKIFPDGHDALDFLKEQWKEKKRFPDVILLDLYLVSMNGWQFLNILSTLPGIKDNLPLIWMCTVDMYPDVRRKANEHLMVDRFIIKPLRMEEIEALTESLDSKAAQV